MDFVGQTGLGSTGILCNYATVSRYLAIVKPPANANLLNTATEAAIPCHDRGLRTPKKLLAESLPGGTPIVKCVPAGGMANRNAATRSA